MPPPDSHKSLTRQQIDLLWRWIKDGAVYQLHWAYEPPVKPAVAGGAAAIDDLVRRRLASQGLRPATEADRRTLIRRLSFDLVGLPPRPEEVDAFVSDASPDAYEQLVERLLASPHFGERMAQGWLDVVRFADTIGYHSDNPHEVWPYRDYVIKSFNDNKPFDQFTIEQLAGDLLPESTQEQLVGSCFNRLLLTTEEGGAQPKDYEARMLTDRVRAVGTVWLGQTFGCCQCHDHKFDPMTSEDFYSLGAFFADIEEPIIGAREPGMLLATAEQEAELARLRNAAAPLRQQYDATSPELLAAEEAWEQAVLAELEYAERRQALKPAGKRLRRPPNARCCAAATIPPPEIVAIIRLKASDRTPEQQAALLAHFKSQLPELADLRSRTERGRESARPTSKAVCRAAWSQSRWPRRARCASCPAATGWTKPARSSSPRCRTICLSRPRDARPPADAARSGPLDRLARQSAHGARVRQPAVEAVLRHRPVEDARRPRLAGRMARPTPSCSTGWPASSWTAAGT